MMNLQKKSFSLGVVALLLWALALAFTISWLLNREIVPLLQPGAVVRWPQLTLLIYLTIFTITACVGLPMLVLAYHWLFAPGNNSPSSSIDLGGTINVCHGWKLTTAQHMDS